MEAQCSALLTNQMFKKFGWFLLSTPIICRRAAWHQSLRSDLTWGISMSAWWAGRGGRVNHSTLTITFYYLPGESVEQTWDLDLPVIFSEEIPPSRVAGRLREDNSALSVLRWDKWLMFTRQRQEYDKWHPSATTLVSSRQTESKNNYHERGWLTLTGWLDNSAGWLRKETMTNVNIKSL